MKNDENMIMAVSITDIRVSLATVTSFSIFTESPFVKKLVNPSILIFVFYEIINSDV